MRSHDPRRALLVGAYALAILWTGGVLLWASSEPAAYEGAMQEDRPVEWATVVLFLAAAVVRLRVAFRERRPFDALVGLFCVFVAGEEFSWGQRLVGFTPPGAFLERNTQQEFNIHNFADVFGRPKWVLMMSLAGYGLVLPGLSISSATRQMLDRVRATPPAIAFAPLFAAAIGLLYWYPFTFTGEWVEALAGMLFLASAPIGVVPFAATLALTPVAAFALAMVSASRRAADPAFIACAMAETRALVTAIVDGNGATDDLVGRSIHKRLWTAIKEEYLRPETLTALSGVPCAGEDDEDISSRRRYGVDPWGTAYWISTRRDELMVVYSFGPNRRRDGEPEDNIGTGDDIVAARQ